MLLDRIGDTSDPSFAAAARRIDAAVDATVGSGIATADLGGTASTAEFTDALIARVRDL